MPQKPSIILCEVASGLGTSRIGAAVSAAFLLAAFMLAAAALPWSTAGAADQCRELFSPRAAERLHLTARPEHVSSWGRLQRAWQRLDDDFAAGRDFHPQDIELLIDEGMQLLRAQGVSFTKIEYGGYPALEIEAGSSANGWSRMARSIRANLHSRLLFAPMSLIIEDAKGSFFYSKTGAPHDILIARASLLHGRGVPTNLHEIRHAWYAKQSAHSDSILQSRYLVNDPDSGLKLSSRASDYQTYMSTEELGTHARDLVLFLRDLRDRERFLDREERMKLRLKIRQRASRTLELVENVHALGTFVSRVVGHLRLDTIERAGPVTDASGPVENMAHLQLSTGETVFLTAASERIVQLEIEGRTHSAALTLRFGDMALAGVRHAEQLVSLLQTDHLATRTATQVWLAKELGNWVARLREHETRYASAMKYVRRGSPTLPASELLAPLADLRL